jgi:hypothetical protein
MPYATSSSPGAAAALLLELTAALLLGCLPGCSNSEGQKPLAATTPMTPEGSAGAPATDGPALPSTGTPAVDGQCPAGQELCDAACFDTATSAQHCGGCGQLCGAGSVCMGGDCTCPGGGVDCGGTCIDTMTNAQNCGGCGMACSATQTCMAGACGCVAPYSPCGPSCIDLQVDVMNCGGCGMACGTGSSCVAGACTCQAGLDSCPSGCTDLEEDGNNCGACGTVCAAGQVCSLGVCSDSCAAELLQCGASCVDAATSVTHCGDCDHACAAGQSCEGGLCACADGQIACGNLCVDTQSSLSHCGACDSPCGGGATCTAGACTCPDAGQTACGGQCSDVMTDAQNCGSCGNVCRTGLCEAGACPPVKQCAVKTAVTDPVVATFEEYDGSTPLPEWVFTFNGGAGTPEAVYAGTYTYAEASDMTQMSSMVLGNNSEYALSVTSEGAIEWGGGLGLWMTCVDASAFDGISFWVRGTVPNGMAYMSLSMESTNPPDENEPLSGGTCSLECTGPGVDVPVTDVWTRVFLRWSDFEPGTADGASIPATGDEIAGIQWNISIAYDEMGAPLESPYELYVDNIQFFASDTSCAAGEETCSNACVDTSSNPANCGGCGNVCAAEATCAGGTCMCPGGATQCLQECVDTSTNTAHCGGCGNVCALTATCTGGECTGGDSTTSTRCGSSMNLLGNPFGCEFAWGVNDEGSLPSTVDFFSKWVGYENDIMGSCDGCSWLSGLLSQDVVPMYIAYFIAYRGKLEGFDDCNLDFDGQNLCTHGGQFIKDNRNQIVDIYESYARRSYQAYPNKPVIWLIEPDFIQYTSSDQNNPLSMGELGSLATDIVCAIKSNMPNAVIALTHSSWIREPEYSSYWSNMPLDLADFVHATGRADTAPYLNDTDANNRSDGTWSYLGSLTGKPIIADTSFGVTEMSDSWSTSSASTLNGHISSGLAGVLVGAPPGDYQSNVESLRPNLDSTCQ